MASPDINVGMGVSGISQFKSAMSQASASVKTLDAALKLNEKQFKASGDAETYMKQQASLLKSQITAQQTVVKNAEKALEQMTKNGTDKASVSYQKMQQQAIKAQDALLDMQTALKDVESGESGASQGADEVGKSFEKLGNDVANVSKRADFSAVISGLQSITNVVEQAASKVRDFAVGAWNELMSVAGNADDVLTQSTIFGLTPEEYQRMSFAAASVDTEVETIINARKKLNYNIGSGNKNTAGAFQFLGIDLYEADPNASIADQFLGNDKKLRDWEDIFWETGEAMLHMQEAGQAIDLDTYSQQIFGKSWNQLMPLFASGREKYDDAMKSAGTNSQKSLEDLSALNDKVDELKSNFQVLETETLAAFAPTLTDIADKLGTFFQRLTEYLQTDEGKKSLEGISEAMSSLFEDLSNVDFGTAMETVKTAIERLKDGLVWLKDNKNTVVTTIEAIAKAFVGMKVAEGVLTFMNLLTGAKGLFSGGVDMASAGASAGASWGNGFAGAVIKAAPWLVGLYTLLNPSNGGAEEYADSNGIVNKSTQMNLGVQTLDEAELLKARLRMSGYGALTESQYGAFQEYWDYYRDPNRNPDLANYEWEYLTNQFWGRGKAFKAMAAEMYQLDPTMEDLPDDFFKIPAIVVPNIEDLQLQLTEANLQVPVQFVLGSLNGIIAGMTNFTPHASGLDYVPYNGYPAILHKGERVMTRWENEAYMGGGYSIDDLTNAVTYALGSVGIYMGSDQVGNLTTNRVSNNIAKRSNARLRSMGG